MIASAPVTCNQPGINTAINYSAPLAAGLACAFMHGRDYVRNVWATIALKSPIHGTALRESSLPNFKYHKKGMRGMWSGTTPGPHYFNFGTAPFDFNTTPHTILVAYWPISHPTTTNYGRLFQVLSTASSVGYQLAQETDGSFTRAIQLLARGSTNKKRHTNNSAYTLLTPLTVVVTNETGLAATTVRMYIDGVEVSYNTTGQTDGVSLLSAAGAMIVGNSGFAAEDTNTRQLDGVVPVVLVWNRVLTESEIKDITLNPYSVFKSTADTFANYYNDVIVGGSVTLTVADAVHSHIVDGITLTTDSSLSVLEAIHSHNVTTLTLSTTGDTALSVAESFHNQSTLNLQLATEWLLTVADANHGLTSSNITLSLAADQSLTVADSSHTHTTDSLVLTLAAWLSIAAATQNQTADSLLLSLQNFLQLANSTQNHRADNVTLNTGAGGGGLTIEEILAAVKADPSILTISRWLVLREIM